MVPIDFGPTEIYELVRAVNKFDQCGPPPVVSCQETRKQDSKSKSREQSMIDFGTPITIISPCHAFAQASGPRFHFQVILIGALAEGKVVLDLRK